VIYFDGRSLRLEALVKFIHESLDIAEEIIATRLLFQQDKRIPEVDLNMVDDPSNHHAGHYFGKHESGAWKSARIRMLHRIRASKLDENTLEMEGDHLAISQAAKDAYRKSDELFREIIAILMMFTCGISGRGTEMTSLRWKNTMDGDRSIYVEDRQIMFITEYHKSMALIDDQKVHTFNICLT